MNKKQLSSLLQSISNKIDNNIKDFANSLEDDNKYILITNDEPLTIKTSDITDITDATITIDNLTGEFGDLVANENGTYTYTLNTIMTDVETFVFKVNGDEQNVVIAPYREMVYDDDNGAITYTGTWTIDEDNNHSNGTAHVTTINDTNSNAAITFNFTGTGVYVYTRIDATTGTIAATLKRVDELGNKTNVKGITVDNESTSNTYYQIPTLFFEDLEYGTYEVKIYVTTAAERRSTYYLDSIRVYSPLNNLNESINNLYQVKDTNPSVLYTDRGNIKYIPTREYDPATKIYVDDAVTNVTDITNSKLDKTLLNGGTTGQILSKKSDSNNDVQWVNPQIKVINPSNLQEFLTMTSENGLYYVPETCNVSINEFYVSTSARGDIISYSLCGLNEVIDDYYYGKKYINYNQYLYFYYDIETEKITNLVILMDYISSIEDAVNILPSKAYVDNKVAGIVDSAPETLNTLNELAAALGDDANFATTVTNSLANKADKEHTHSQYLTEHQSLDGLATEEYVNNKISNLSIQTLTKTEYDSLETKDPNTLYLITE